MTKHKNLADISPRTKADKSKTLSPEVQGQSSQRDKSSKASSRFAFVVREGVTGVEMDHKFPQWSHKL